MNRIYRFDTAETILIVQVVFCHAITFCDGPLSLKEFARFSILGCAMPVFMFISGWFSKSELSIRSVLGLSTLCVICNTVSENFYAHDPRPRQVSSAPDTFCSPAARFFGLA